MYQPSEPFVAYLRKHMSEEAVQRLLSDLATIHAGNCPCAMCNPPSHA